MAVQPDLYRTLSETPKTGFLTTRLTSPCAEYYSKLGCGLLTICSLSNSVFDFFSHSGSEARILVQIVPIPGHSVKFLNFRTSENFAVINLKFKQRGKT